MYSIYNTHNNKQHNNQESHNDKIQVTAKYILAPFHNTSAFAGIYLKINIHQ